MSLDQEWDRRETPGIVRWCGGRSIICVLEFHFSLCYAFSPHWYAPPLPQYLLCSRLPHFFLVFASLSSSWFFFLWYKYLICCNISVCRPKVCKVYSLGGGMCACIYWCTVVLSPVQWYSILSYTSEYLVWQQWGEHRAEEAVPSFTAGGWLGFHSYQYLYLLLLGLEKVEILDC